MPFKKDNKLATVNKGKKQRKPRPEKAARESLRDLLFASGARQKAITTLTTALGNKDKHGCLTTAAVKAAELILHYCDGPPDQKHEHSGKVEIVVTYE